MIYISGEEAVDQVRLRAGSRDADEQARRADALADELMVAADDRREMVRSLLGLEDIVVATENGPRALNHANHDLVVVRA